MNTARNTRSGYRKTAISVPRDVLDGVDAAARERGESRSAFIARVLRAAVRARRDAEITRRLDELFADPRVCREEQAEAQALAAAAAIDIDDERW